MKGFDDHLDNYGDPDPGDEEGESDADWAARLESEVEEARRADEAHDVVMWAKQWNPALYQKILEEEYTSESETAEILADPDTMDAIREGEADDGITTDDFDNWPAEREFPS